jgi:hypothetical protein
MAKMDWDKARIRKTAHEQGTVFVGVVPTGEKKKNKKKKKPVKAAASPQAAPPQKERLSMRRQQRLQRLAAEYLNYVNAVLVRGERPTSVPRELHREVEAAGGPELWARSRPGESADQPRAPGLVKRSELIAKRSARRIVSRGRPNRRWGSLAPNGALAPPASDPPQQVIENFRAAQRRRRDREMQKRS